MTRRRRVTITVVTIIVVTIVVIGVATVIAAVPARPITINGSAIVVIIVIAVIVVVGKVLESRRRRRSMVDNVLNTGGIRKGILRGIRSLEKVQGRRGR